MLAVFFGLVLVCAVFFSIGFSLGRRTTMTSLNNPQSASGQAGAARPSPGKDNAPQPGSQSSDFSFYKSVGSNSANTELATAEPARPTQAQQAQSQTQAQAQAQPPAATPGEAPAATTPAASTAPPAAGGYFVQVAAVSRQEDAEALVEALKKKQYPAFAANNSSADKYYHIQVGPYADLKDAEAMRARLIADGYNPIVKK